MESSTCVPFKSRYIVDNPQAQQLESESILKSVPADLLESFLAKCKSFEVLSKAGSRADYYLFKPKLAAFLAARDQNLDAAFKMWTEWLNWRETEKIFDIKWDDVKQDYYSGKIIIPGRDREGRLCFVFKARRHIPGDTNTQRTLRLIYYMLEQLEDRTRNEGRFQIVAINDRENVSMSNVDTGFISLAKELVVKLQNYYPEKILRIYILHPNFLFKTLFAVIKPFLQKRTTDKINILDNLKDLSKTFDPEGLLIEMGGLLPDPFIDYESKKDVKGNHHPKFSSLFYMLDQFDQKKSSESSQTQ